MTALGFRAGPLSIAAVGAHPDDIEIGCGGTLLALVSRRDTTVRSLVVTGDGERRREAETAAAAFGVAAPVTFADLPDAHLPAHWDAAKSALHAFADDVGPVDVVFAPRPDDAHQDHAVLGALATTVWRGPLVLHYEIPKWDGDLGRPNVSVPLDDEIAHRKVHLLNASFPSQTGRHWWDDELFLGLLRLRGVEAGVKYAEAFHTAKVALTL